MLIPFLAKDHRHGTTQYVGVWKDPRKEGFSGDFIEDVELNYDMEAVHRWDDGQPAPDACMGQDPENAKHFTVFKYRSELQAAGYHPVGDAPVLFGTWSDYVKLNPDPGYLEQLDEQQWFERLDEYDEASRRRRQHAPEPDLPTGSSRDDVAAWVARQHLIVDPAVREVWYLPQGAPPDEIRLLELNDRLAGPETNAEAIDFGLDIEGARFRLYVADITSEQLDRIKRDPSRLPRGWSIDDNRIWRRGA